MYQPKRTKFSKFQRKRPHTRKRKRENYIVGSTHTCAHWRIINCTGVWVNPSKIETLRVTLNSKLNAIQRVNMFAHIGYTANPPSVRMGKGKPNVYTYTQYVPAGSTLFTLYDASHISVQLHNGVRALSGKLETNCRVIPHT
jgi:ribosomal protein L16/L10AE